MAMMCACEADRWHSLSDEEVLIALAHAYFFVCRPKTFGRVAREVGAQLADRLGVVWQAG